MVRELLHLSQVDCFDKYRERDTNRGTGADTANSQTGSTD